MSNQIPPVIKTVTIVFLSFLLVLVVSIVIPVLYDSLFYTLLPESWKILSAFEYLSLILILIGLLGILPFIPSLYKNFLDRQNREAKRKVRLMVFSKELPSYKKIYEGAWFNIQNTRRILVDVIDGKEKIYSQKTIEAASALHSIEWKIIEKVRETLESWDLGYILVDWMRSARDVADFDELREFDKKRIEALRMAEIAGIDKNSKVYQRLSRSDPRTPITPG